MLQSGSTPSFNELDPREVPYQARLVNDMAFKMDYSLGVHEILLSGSVGSAKSIIATHQMIKHCFRYSGARGLLGRKSMPDLRDTIYAKCVEHLDGAILADGTELKEGRHYFLKDSTCSITFFNGSKIISRSWHDRRYKRLGSLEISCAIIEELTENDADDEMALRYVRMRVGRLPHIPEQWIIYCTNPDAPSHFAYDYFDIGKRQMGHVQNLPKTRHVYFSSTKDNKFLPDWYITQLENDLDPKLARRMIHGEWVEIASDTVYHSYGEHNFVDTAYEIDPNLPIDICHDFNISKGKPMSACFCQYDPTRDTFHIFGECIIEGADTEEVYHEAEARGFLDHDNEYCIYGDATGDSRSPNSKKSNYDIIKEYLGKFRRTNGGKIPFTVNVPRANPPVRERHNVVNAYCKNALGKTRLYVYKTAPTVHKGMRLTELKKGGQYVEDDSKPYQHVTTALGYRVHREWKKKQSTSGIRTSQIR